MNRLRSGLPCRAAGIYLQLFSTITYYCLVFFLFVYMVFPGPRFQFWDARPCSGWLLPAIRV